VEAAGAGGRTLFMGDPRLCPQARCHHDLRWSLLESLIVSDSSELVSRRSELAMAPEVACGGDKIPRDTTEVGRRPIVYGTTNDKVEDHGLYPLAFQAMTSQRPAPAFNVTPAPIEQVPVPL
jgi:hypothetical protein